MKYFSLDTETTGTDRQNHQVLSAALVFEDTNKNPLRPVEELPYFEGRVVYSELVGSPFALNLNRDLIASMPKNPDRANGWYSNTTELCGLMQVFIRNLRVNLALGYDDPIIIAGKNVAGFDLQFLPEFRRICHYRTLDVGSVIMGADRERWEEKDIPSLNELVPGQTHNALDDARDVITALRRVYEID